MDVGTTVDAVVRKAVGAAVGKAVFDMVGSKDGNCVDEAVVPGASVEFCVDDVNTGLNRGDSNSSIGTSEDASSSVVFQKVVFVLVVFSTKADGVPSPEDSGCR